MIDIHTHVLQGVDHGANNLNDSLLMLKTLENDGVNKIYCTSHYYSDAEPSTSFFDRYEKALDELKSIYNSNITLMSGAEVYISPFFGASEIDRRLCLENTDLMLVELPFWQILPDWTFEVLERLVVSGITPIIAHVERCLGARKKRIIKKLHKIGAIMHVDSVSVGTDHFVDWCIKKGYVSIVASDYHVDIPYVSIKTALEVIEKKFGREKAENICSAPDRLLI